MREGLNVAIVGQKRLFREGGIEVVVKDFGLGWHNMAGILPVTVGLVIT